MKKLLMVGALVMSTGAVAGAPQLDCTFKNSDSDEIMEFSYRPIGEMWLMVGNNGAAGVAHWMKNGRITLSETTGTGNENWTTMLVADSAPYPYDAVHSRHMWLSGPIFSQFRGTCKWRGSNG